jgi:predicted amidohydrolase YtcJ
MKISHQDLILINGNIITLDPFCPRATWAVIKKEKIITTGKGKDWKNHKNNNSTIIDCSRQTVIPGLIDAHLHLVSYAKSFVTADISPGKNVHSISDIQTIN